MDFKYSWRFGKMNAKPVFYIDSENVFITKNSIRDTKAMAVCRAIELGKTKDDIIRFDSIMEYKYYLYLLSNKNVSNIEIHKPFLLIDSFTSIIGVEHKAEYYECDFYYLENGKPVVVDTKGMIEGEFAIKWKQFDEKYNKQGLSLKVIRLTKKDYLNIESWEQVQEMKSKTIIKLREENKRLKEEKHKREMEERKKERLKARKEELLNKGKLTATERKRLFEIEEMLK